MNDLIRSYITQCKSCPHVAEGEDHDKISVCAKCSGVFGHKHISEQLKWLRKEERLKPMLWSMFPHCQILWRESPDFARMGRSRLVFDVMIPEYRIAIDFIDDHQLVIDDMGPRSWRVVHDQHKKSCLYANNYRWVVLPSDPDVARNKLIEVLNEVYVLDTNLNAPQILTPRLQGDAGWDLVCNQDVVCQPGVGTDIPSQVYLEIPNHLYAIVQARSSTSKKRLLVLPGVIDPSYRGQIFTMTFNPTSEPIEVRKGDRISQLLFFPRIPHLHINPVSKLRPSERGSRGFGSTG